MVHDAVSVRFEPPGSARAVAPIWQGLQARFGEGRLTCSWEWTRTWLHHYGDLVPHRFVIAESAGGVCGVALVSEGVGRRRGPFKIRTLYLGTAGEPLRDTIYLESNRLLVIPHHRPAFARSLLQELGRDRSWHELKLPGIVPCEAAPFLEAHGGFDVRREVCRVVDLDAVRTGGGDLLSALRAGTRQRIRRSLRGFGSIEINWGDTPASALEILEELMALHQDRWGEAGYFFGPRARAFHRELVPQLVARGQALLARTRSGGRTVGCLYVLVDRGRAMSYQSGLGRFDDKRLKPGMTTEYLVMKHCLERGHHEYDFLAKDTRYKREMSTTERELLWATLRSPHLLWFAIDAGSRLKRSIGRVPR